MIEDIDHTADVGLRAQAATFAEAFALAAGGMFDIIITNRRQVQPVEPHVIQVQATGWEDLLVAWLEELLYLFELQRYIPATIEVQDIAPDHLTAQLHGESLDSARHELGVQIKAVTYHQLRAEQTDEGFAIQVIFDI